MSFAAKRAYEPFAAILSKVQVMLESIVSEDQICPEIGEAQKVLAFRARRNVCDNSDQNRYLPKATRSLLPPLCYGCKT